MARFSTACLTAALLCVTAGVDAFAPRAVSSATAATAAASGSSTSASALFAADGPRTLYDKIWDDHVVTQDDSSALIYIDRHLVHEVRTCTVLAAARVCVLFAEP